MNAAQQINQTSGEVEYYTPPAIVLAAQYVLGGLPDLDPASSEAANKTVRALRIFTKADDGLKQPWDCERLWMNHPFSREGNPLWIQKLISEQRRVGFVACCITYACTSEEWFRPLLELPQCFLWPRTNYLLPDGTVYRGVTKGSVVTLVGGAGLTEQFRWAFRKLGTVKV